MTMINMLKDLMSKMDMINMLKDLMSKMDNSIQQKHEISKEGYKLLKKDANEMPMRIYIQKELMQ